MNSYRLLFETSEEKDVLPQKVLWIAVFIAFLIANAPPKKISPVILAVLNLLPQKLIAASFHQDLQHISESIVSLVVVPTKKLLFFLALLVMGYPIKRSLSRSAPFWRKLGLKRMAVSALFFFVSLCLITIPFASPQGPHHHRSGLSGMGILYGHMSINPFAENDDVLNGRLLKPAIANFIHLDGYFRYYLLSLASTYILVFLALAFIESKTLNVTNAQDSRQSVRKMVKWIMYLSVMTSSFVMVSFQWPGLPEHFVFILTLLMACIPMAPQARLGILALCTLSHDGSTLALIPVILFYFPKGERIQALLVIFLFNAVALASYGFSFSNGLQGHGAVLRQGSVWLTVIQNPGYLLAGLFYSYKLFWIVFLYILWMLWSQKDKATVAALLAITLFPVLLCLIAWDTTRLGAVGFLGMLITLVIFISEQKRLPKLHYQVLLVIIGVSAFIPSFNVVMAPRLNGGPPIYLDSLSDYPYPGLYKLINSMVFW